MYKPMFHQRSVARNHSRHRVISTINTTPMIDVILVLLVVFMITAPLLTVGVIVNMPKTVAQKINNNEKPLTITINAGGVIFLQNQPIELKNLLPRMKAIGGEGYDQRVYVRADAQTPYDQVARVLAFVNTAGFSKIALITDRQDN